VLRRLHPRGRAPGWGRLGIAPLVLALTLGGLAPMLVAPAPACATSGESAALVVDTGGRATRYCVAMDEARVNGIELIQLAAQQYGLDYRLGYGGAAVCRLDHVGIEGGECFTDSDAFWGYWRGTGGGWSWSSTGAASTVVEPGDVEGWSWGTGRDGSTHPPPPPTSYASACGGPSPSPDPGDGGGGGGGGGDPSVGTGGGGDAATLPREGAAEGGKSNPPAGGGAADAGGGGRTPDGKVEAPAEGDERPASTPASSEPSPEPSPVDATPLAAAPLDRTGPPVSALVSAGGAIVLLLFAGWLSLRRRPGG
jgi:hypothetical protein